MFWLADGSLNLVAIWTEIICDMIAFILAYFALKGLPIKKIVYLAIAMVIMKLPVEIIPTFIRFISSQ